MEGRHPSHCFKHLEASLCLLECLQHRRCCHLRPFTVPSGKRERATADNKITITACTASIPSGRRAEGLICGSPGSFERKLALSLCYQHSVLVGDWPSHPKDDKNGTQQCLPAWQLGFDPRVGHTKDYKNDSYCLPSWCSLFTIGLDNPMIPEHSSAACCLLLP